MVKLLHFADVHLGMTNFGTIDATTGLHSRVLEFLESLDILCEVAASENPDLILFAGDAFRSRIPNPTLVTQFSNRIQILANIAPVVMVVGNHDRQSTGDEKHHSIDIMRELKADHEIYVCDDIGGIEVAGTYVVTLPWFYDLTIDEICDQLDAALARAPRSAPCILLGHCAVAGAVPSESYDYSIEQYNADMEAGGMVFPLEIFCNDAWDYVALGHIHAHQCMCDSPPVVYTGSLDRVNWGERDGSKGFVIANIVAGEADWEFVNLDTRRMVQIEIDEKCIPDIADIDVSDAIVRVLVSSSKPIEQSSVLRKVVDSIGEYYILDSVSVVVSKVAREQRYESKHYEAMSVLDVMDIYIEEKFGDDPDYADKIYNAAIDLMERAKEME